MGVLIANIIFQFLGEHKKKIVSEKSLGNITLEELENNRNVGWESSLILTNSFESWEG